MNRLDTYSKMPSGMKEYLEAYGWHFSKKMCEWATGKMKCKDETGKAKKLEPMKKDEVEELLKKHNVKLENDKGYDAVYVANMAKNDFYKSAIADEQHLALFVKDYIDDVAVDEAPGAVPVQQIHKALEAPVGKALQIVDVPGGGVGEEDVKAPVAPELEAQPGDPPAHLLFGVHVVPGPVPEGAAQAQNAQAPADHDAVLGAQAALRRPDGEPVVVVAADIDHRAACQGAQKLQVVPAQIPAGEDQIQAGESAGSIVVVVKGGLLIGDGQDAHRLPLPWGAGPAGQLSFSLVASTPTMPTVALPVSLRAS